MPPLALPPPLPSWANLAFVVMGAVLALVLSFLHYQLSARKEDRVAAAERRKTGLNKKAERPAIGDDPLPTGRDYLSAEEVLVCGERGR